MEVYQQETQEVEKQEDGDEQHTKYDVITSIVTAYCDFYRQHQQHPNARSCDSMERMVATWRSDTKNAFKKGTCSLTDEHQHQLLLVDPDFFKYENTSDSKMQMLKAYCDFYRLNKKQPTNLSKSLKERSLTNWRTSMKNAAKGHGRIIALNDDQRKQVLSVDPDFFSTHKSCKQQTVTDYCIFFRLNKRTPSRISPDLNERTLAHWKSHMKLADKGLGIRRVGVTSENRKLLLLVDPDFFNYTRYRKTQRINEYCDFYRLHQRQPYKIVTNDIEQHLEQQLGRWRNTMKQAAKNNGKSIPLNDEQREQILAVDPDFFEEQDFVVLKMQRVNEYCDFYMENKRQPSRCSIYYMERKIATWRNDMKTFKKYRALLDEEQRERLLLVDPYFFDGIDTTKTRKVTEYCDFYQENKRQPMNNSLDVNERMLAQWRRHMKQANKGNSEHIPLNDEQRSHVLLVDPNFFQDKDINALKMKRLDEYCNFYRINQRQPSRCSVDVNERAIGQWRNNMKASSKSIGRYIPLNQEQREIVLAIDPNFYKDNECTKRNRINDYCEFIRLNHRQPIKTSTDSIERKIGQWRSDMKTAVSGRTKRFPLSEEQSRQLLSADPNFFQDNV